MNVEAMTWPRWLPRVLWMGRRCPRCDCVQFKPAELRFFDGVRRQNSIRPKLHLLLTVRGTNSELIFGVNGGVSRRLRTGRRPRIAVQRQTPLGIHNFAVN